MEENLKQNKSGNYKIAMFGPESTGKTNISNSISSLIMKQNGFLNFMRDYLQDKME
jgi:ABC-type molybdate transport system ATPase subunit